MLTKSLKVRRSPVKSAAAVASALALMFVAACGGGSDADQAGEGGEKDALRVTSLGFCSEVPLFWGIDKGLFEDEGVTVEAVKSGGGGSTTVSAVQGGSADVAFTAWPELLQAIGGGLDFHWIATAYNYPMTEDQATSGTIVLEDSDIKSFADLEGKKVAMTAVGGVGEATLNEAIINDGGDPKKMTIVTLPLAQLAPAVEKGQVAAAQIQLPYQSTKKLRDLGDSHLAATKGISTPWAGYAVTGKFLKDNPGAAEKFFKGLSKAHEQLTDPANEEEMYQVASKNCGQEIDALKSTPFNPMVSTVDMDGLAKFVEILGRGGVVDAADVDLTKHVPEFARN